MTATFNRGIYFSYFMFTADLRPADAEYSNVIVKHLTKLTEMGYDGFDVHIAPQEAGVDHKLEVDSYARLKKVLDGAGLQDVKICTNVGTTRTFDITSPYEEQRRQGLAYLKSRVDITSILGGESIMSGPFLYPYGVFPVTDAGDSLWSDALQDWMEPRYAAARAPFQELVAYATEKNVTLAIEPVKNWEIPGPTMVSEVLDFLDGFDSRPAGVAVDTAQVVLESQGPSAFQRNIARAAQHNQLHYVHISAPDRGAVADSWIPWKFMLSEIEAVYQGPYLVEVFNAVPPFDSSMRMARRRFWRPGEDDPVPGRPSAYDVAEAALNTLRTELAAIS